MPNQSEVAGLGDRVTERLAALGVTLVNVSPGGVTSPVGPCRDIERLIVTSPVFVGYCRARWAELAEPSRDLVELLPGIWLAPLPEPRRRRVSERRDPLPIRALLLAGHDLLECEPLRAICDHAGLDHTATLTRINPATLMTAPEAHRTAMLIAWMLDDSNQIDRRFSELHTVSSQLGESYEELSLLYRLSSNMTINQPAAAFLTDACMELQQVVGLRWMALQLVDEEPRLNELQGQIFTAGAIRCDAKLLKRIGALLMRRQDAGAGPMVVDDTQTLGIPTLNRLAGQLLVVPLMREDKPLGILYGGDKIDESHISSVDSKLVNSLANSLSMFLENMMLYEDMSAMFMGTLHALTASIDAKDRYTRGHSERVAMLSRQLAEAAGLEPAMVERIYLAGLVHDVGKIGVPERVLCKPGRLTDAEFEQIKSHPEIGGRILQDIRQMKDLIPGVLHHHERWDGRGYPTGLAGTDIPLFGRVICLADSFDAMSSTRTYRASMSHEKVLAEVRRCAGTQFDPELTEVFLRLEFGPYLSLVEKHQVQQTDPHNPVALPAANAA